MTVQINNKIQFMSWEISPNGEYYNAFGEWKVPVDVVKFNKKIEVRSISRVPHGSIILETTPNQKIPLFVLDDDTKEAVEKEWPEMFL